MISTTHCQLLRNLYSVMMKPSIQMPIRTHNQYDDNTEPLVIPIPISLPFDFGILNSLQLESTRKCTIPHFPTEVDT